MPCLVIGIILIVIYSIIVLFNIGTLPDDYMLISSIVYCVIFSPLFLIGVGLIIAFIINANVKRSKRKKFQKESDELLDELWNNYISYGPCLLGFEFTIPDDLTEIRDLLLSGRANNIRDAVNTMLDDKHKRQLESFAAATAKYAQSAAISSGISAVNSGITAVNSGIATLSILTKF